VNGWDGFGDLAIGWRFASGELEEEGRVDVVSGRSGRVLASWPGEAAHDRFGAALTVVPDVDGDGKPEVAASTQPKRGERFATPQGTVGERPATVRVLGSRHAELFRVTSPACSLFGSSLAALPPSGDLPATLAITQSCHRRGVHLVSAADGERLREIHAPGIERWEGSFKFGRRVLPFRDLDGDGVDDLFVTAPSDFPVHPAGVVSRARDAIPTLVCVEPERVTSFERWPTGLGMSACTLGDLDGDGIDDLAIGGAWAPCGESCAGSVLVCSGKDARPLRWFTRKGLGG
jgi:hypothetical protein